MTADRHRHSQGHGYPRGRQLPRPRRGRGMGVLADPRSCASIPTYLTRRTIPLPTGRLPRRLGRHRHAPAAWWSPTARCGSPRAPGSCAGSIPPPARSSRPSSCSAPSTSPPTPPARCTSTIVGRIHKLNPATNTVVWTSDAVQSEITSIAVAGGFVWLTTSCRRRRDQAQRRHRAAGRQRNPHQRRRGDESSPATERSG